MERSGTIETNKQTNKPYYHIRTI